MKKRSKKLFQLRSELEAGRSLAPNIFVTGKTTLKLLPQSVEPRAPLGGFNVRCWPIAEPQLMGCNKAIAAIQLNKATAATGRRRPAIVFALPTP